jgi:hypothetical protein
VAPVKPNVCAALTLAAAVAAAANPPANVRSLLRDADRPARLAGSASSCSGLRAALPSLPRSISGTSALARLVLHSALVCSMRMLPRSR